MRTRITIDLDDDSRRALSRYYGRGGLATRKTITTFVEGLVDSTLRTIYSEQSVEDRRRHDKETSGHED